VSNLDAKKLKLGVSVFIAVKTNQHNAEWIQRFRKIAVSFPEVVDFYRLSGDVDYLIRAVVSDIHAYDDLYQRLIAKIDLHDVSSMFTMDRSNRQPSCRWSMPRPDPAGMKPDRALLETSRRFRSHRSSQSYSEWRDLRKIIGGE
jgi:DNA-binding Lrp family transcriptional regulator